MNSLKDSNSHRIPKFLSNTRSSCHPNRFSSFYSLKVLLSGSSHCSARPGRILV